MRNQAEANREAPSHFAIPGFELLSPERQQLFMRIPAESLDNARSLIEAEIAATQEKYATVNDGEADIGSGKADFINEQSREFQAVSAIDDFHAAERGDPEARKKLQDHKKEMFDEEPDDEDIFETILESESGNPFAQDLVMETMLSDPEAKATQKVLDLFKDFRGDLPSVDDALSPKLQIELFTQLTKGKGSFPERMEFARKSLELVTEKGQRNLFEGLTDFHVLKSNGLAARRSVL